MPTLYKNKALKYLEGVPRDQRELITERANALAANPHPPGSEKLQNVKDDDGDNVYKVRRGGYRIMYVIKAGPQVWVLAISGRGESYKKKHTQKGRVR